VQADFYRVNLLPKQLQDESTVDLRRCSRLVSVLIIAVLLVALILFLYSINVTRGQLRLVQQQLAELATAEKRAIAIKQEGVELEDTLREYETRLDRRLTLVPLLDQINLIVPTDLWLVDLEINTRNQNGGTGETGRTLLLQGYSQSIASIGVLINMLGQLPGCSQVKLNRVTTDQLGNRFEISAVVTGGKRDAVGTN
jgi:Tfp pilus assembly protein PilN